MADEKPEQTDEKKTDNQPDPWERMRTLIGDTVDERLKAWRPEGNSSQQHSEKGNPPQQQQPENPPSDPPQRQQRTRKEGFLSQFFKGLEE
jgi:hypothetical protein